MTTEHVETAADDCQCDGCKAARLFIRDLRSVGGIRRPNDNEKKDAKHAVKP